MPSLSDRSKLLEEIRIAIHDIQHAMAAMNAKQDATDAKIDSVCAKVDKVDARVTSVDDAIRGNGTPGLRASHQALDQRVESMSSILKWVLGVVTTMVLGIVSWGASQIFGG